MPQQVFGAAAAVSMLNRAFNNASPSNAAFLNQVQEAGRTQAEQIAFANEFAAGFNDMPAQDLVEQVLGNMGLLPNDALVDAGVATLEAWPADMRGAIVLSFAKLIATLENATGEQEIFRDAAKAWNKEIFQSYTYSNNPANTSAFQGDFPAGNPSDGQTFTLTTGQDVFNGTDGNDLVRGVAGQQMGNQDQTTLNSSDILKGGAGADTLILLLNGNYGGGATIRDFETLQLGTNNAAAVNFDYNVNQGAYEITGTNTVVFDQITTGEVLNVNNITPTAADGKAPTLEWANEAGSRAGVVGANYRQATTSGTADNQNVTLKNVSGMAAIGDAILNIGGGMESVTITSTGAVAQNTLNNSNNNDTGNNAVAADIISAGSLGKVVLKGDVAIGKTGGVVAANLGGAGLTDRTAAQDNGWNASAASASNLLSVGSRVTEVDASEMTAAANVRFTAKNDGSATNVTFKGGAGNDYVEFALGNVTTTGGEGNDTFAFIGNGANATFGEGDKLDGGAGTDTIQLGVNGVGTFNISETELRNKTGIDVLDMRGTANNLTLSSDFVAASDAGDRVAVHTDRIVQTSADNAANTVNGGWNAWENDSTNTIRLTQLTSSQGVDFFGGSGSDRIILNDRTFNVLQNLDGGVYNDAAAIGSGRADTITVVTNGENVVIDAQDLSNVRNFEGLVLTKNAASATYNITLTEAFLLANTQGLNRGNTTWDDSVFQLGTAAAANNAALGAGDTVNVDISDLLGAGGALKGSLAGRGVDYSSLTAAGVTVNFIGGNGATVLKADANGAHVLASSAEFNNAAAAGRTLTATGNSANTTSGFEIQGNQMATAQDDTIVVNALNLINTAVLNGSAGNDTLQLRGGSSIALAAVSNIETLDLVGAATMTANQHDSFTTINASGLFDGIAMTMTDANTATRGAASVESYALNGAGATPGTPTFTVGSLTQNVTEGSTNIQVRFADAGAYTGTFTSIERVFLGDGVDVSGATGINASLAEAEFGAGASVTMNGATYTAIAGLAAVNLSATGNETVTITDSTANYAANAALENYVLNGANADSITFDETNDATLADGIRAGMSVNLAGGGADRVVIDNGALDDTVNSAIRITGFGADDVLQLSVAGTSTSDGTFYNDSLGALAANAGDIVEIDAATYQIGTPGNTANLLTFLAGAGLTGAAANDIITVVAYNGAGQAAIYQLDNSAIGAYDSAELIGIVNAANNSLTAANFA